MNNFTKHRIEVFGINGCHDAIKSSLVHVNKIIIERNSPADKNTKMNEAIDSLSSNLIEKIDAESFKKIVDNNRAQGILIKAQCCIRSGSRPSQLRANIKNLCWWRY